MSRGIVHCSSSWNWAQAGLEQPRLPRESFSLRQGARPARGAERQVPGLTSLGSRLVPATCLASAGGWLRRLRKNCLASALAKRVSNVRTRALTSSASTFPSHASASLEASPWWDGGLFRESAPAPHPGDATLRPTESNADASFGTGKPKASDLEELGLVHVPGAFSAQDAGMLLDLLWAGYEQRHGISRHESEGWSTKKGSGKRLYGPLPQGMHTSPSFYALIGRLHDALDGLWGEGLWRRRGKGSTTVFVNCPNSTRSWSVPIGWHTDIPVNPSDPCEEAQVLYAFAFLDVVEPGGGATMLLTGSSKRAQVERLKALAAEEVNFTAKGDSSWVHETRSKEFMQALAEESTWFKDLFGPNPLETPRDYRYLCSKGISEDRIRRFMLEGTESAGIPMRVVELAGQPGDIVLWDPRCLHSSSENRSSRPRSVIRFRLDLPLDRSAMQIHKRVLPE
ncbi:unnamed protein product [Polarella glacialis]|uniref:Uncharacterized protein n=1 Tax=Polarella glacialis TaxID=89957 RepID=A0A813LHF4_POLGL|nr:unnamed protein product [Polarella glacialis]